MVPLGGDVVLAATVAPPSAFSPTVMAGDGPPPDVCDAPVLLHGLGRKPTSIDRCPYCRTFNTMTKTRTHPNCKTWFSVGAAALIFWPLFWIPLVVDEVRALHIPRCAQYE